MLFKKCLISTLVALILFVGVPLSSGAAPAGTAKTPPVVKTTPVAKLAAVAKNKKNAGKKKAKKTKKPKKHKKHKKHEKHKKNTKRQPQKQAMRQVEQDASKLGAGFESSASLRRAARNNLPVGWVS